ncbi:hypothetical protein PR048_012361 [Dryococelus australis]|uniref:Uncharacterized protein n=1 Tax=Dryococelus australis TaxID=614101 RepID=A0ABQ9HP98_9NEOP|nr:hypothetical protein PR048_012361 [Dryococelus australis]
MRKINIRYAYALHSTGRVIIEVCETSMRNAANEAVLENEGKSDITAAFDSTLQKLSHLRMEW